MGPTIYARKHEETANETFRTWENSLAVRSIGAEFESGQYVFLYAPAFGTGSFGLVSIVSSEVHSSFQLFCNGGLLSLTLDYAKGQMFSFVDSAFCLLLPEVDEAGEST